MDIRFIGRPHCKKVADVLLEFRIRGRQEIRIFYTINKNKAILLHGFIKKSNRIPVRELEQAKQKFYALDKI